MKQALETDAEDFLRFGRSRFARSVLAADFLWLNPKRPGVSKAIARRLFHRTVGWIRAPLLSRAIVRDRRRARAMLEARPDLAELYEAYREQSRSTGVEVSDFMRLYLAVRMLRPRFVLECGTGLSTIALASALRDNQSQHDLTGKCISMEDIPEWAERGRSLLPKRLSPFAEIVVSPRVEIGWQGMLGVGYREIPDLAYDFAFVDGPQLSSPVTGRTLFNADLIGIVSSQPCLWALIDNRLGTVRSVGLAVRSSHDTWYDPVSKLGYLRPLRSGARLRALHSRCPEPGRSQPTPSKHVERLG